jgi:hypothetical protein
VIKESAVFKALSFVSAPLKTRRSTHWMPPEAVVKSNRSPRNRSVPRTELYPLFLQQRSPTIR